ncbi:MAG: hypothetical protein KBF74_05350 [Ferruginibacter sp.]|nr:hypothetical protein [Ferruginibacter sp.]
MIPVIFSLFIIPVIAGSLIMFLPWKKTKFIVITTALLLSAISVYLFINFDQPYYFSVPQYLNKVVAGIDILLLVYFGWVAIRLKNWKVGLLSMIQLALLFYLLKVIPSGHVMQFMVDKLGVFMFLLINIISGIIAVYSTRYIDEEDCSTFRKKYFLTIMFFFIAVMNMVVSADDLEYFYLFFELTTLASFLFIGFRKDPESVRNAITALWMNQVGGLVILVAILIMAYNGYGAATFSNLLANAKSAGILIPLALLSMAALVKGAQMPFNKWLLGAMVAPTPVSALLHSSTMVKIAPFMILRLSPALKDTPVAMVLIALTAFVFVASSIGALSQDNFKKILAHSTIALLALMIMMAAIGSSVTILASLILILFHGLSKSMLFLNAGILEKVFHIKQTSDMDRLGETGPFTSLVITIGFMSLLIPPFGAFIGKWLSIETLGSFAENKNIFAALIIVAVACGGAVLSLLYFKVLGILISRSGENDHIRFENTGAVYSVTTKVLLALVFICMLGLPVMLTGIFVPIVSDLSGFPLMATYKGFALQIGTMVIPLLPMLIAFILFPVTIIAAMFFRFKKVDRAKEYACGEKINYSFSSFYFSIDRAIPWFSIIGVLGLIALLIVALI